VTGEDLKRRQDGFSNGEPPGTTMAANYKHTIEEDREYFRHHALDRLLEISGDWIHSARGMAADGYIDGVSGAKEMLERAQRILEIALERVS
jgi:hypothetical protein